MLIEFKVKNYLSFKDQQVLSMVASSDTSLSENTIKTEILGKRKLLRCAVLFGPNASGKSNFMNQLRHFYRASKKEIYTRIWRAYGHNYAVPMLVILRIL